MSYDLQRVYLSDFSTNTKTLANYTNLSNAISLLGSTECVLIYNETEATKLNYTLIIPENIVLRFEKGAYIPLDQSGNLRCYGRIDADREKIFDFPSNRTQPVVFYHAQPVYPEWFGAVGDGVTDDAAALRCALAAVHTDAELTIDNRFGTLDWGWRHFYTTEGLTTVYGCHMKTSGARITVPNTFEGTVINIDGPRANEIYSLDLHFPEIHKAPSGGNATWAQDAIGIQMTNVRNSKIRIDKVSGFWKGIVARGNQQGFVYNQIWLGNIVNCQYGLQFEFAASGWVNENTWYGGKFSDATGASTENLECVSINAGDETSVILNDHNMFIRPCLESTNPRRTAVIMGGTNNQFMQPRLEGIRNAGFRFTTSAIANKIERAERMLIDPVILDSGSINTVISAEMLNVTTRDNTRGNDALVIGANKKEQIENAMTVGSLPQSGWYRGCVGFTQGSSIRWPAFSIDVDSVAGVNVNTDTLHTLLPTIDTGLTTARGLYYNTSGDAAIGGLTNGTWYYAIPVASSGFKLASSSTNAAAGTCINITGVGGGGTHNFSNSAKQLELQSWGSYSAINLDDDIYNLYFVPGKGLWFTGMQLNSEESSTARYRMLYVDQQYKTFNPSTDITGNAYHWYVTEASHGFYTGERVYYTGSTSISSELTSGEPAYVINRSTNTFRLAKNIHLAGIGTPALLTATPNETHNIQKVRLKFVTGDDVRHREVGIARKYYGAWNPGNIAPGNSVTREINVDFAVPGDLVLANLSSIQHQQCIITGTVVRDHYANIVLANVAASGVTIGSGVLTVAAFEQ